MRSASSEKEAGRTLIATSRPRRVSRARYTSPIPPAPMGAMISYGPSLVLAGSVIGSSLRRKLYGLRYRFASSLQVRSPVDDERERRGVSFLSCVNEKAFPVARYVIMVARWIRRMDVEQGFGICDLERCTLHVDPHRHYFVLGAKEKNFLPITTPSRFAASIARNLPF